MPVRDLDQLQPEARAEVEDYLERVRAGFCAIPMELAEESLDDALTHFLDALDEASTAADVARVAREIGEPDEFAAALCEAISRPVVPGSDAKSIDDGGPGSGRVLGIPWDVRVPTADRVQRRWWSPTDPRVFMPRAWGVGWDINFGALAVKLRLIRPDDENEPFASVPEAGLLAAVAVPLLFTALIAGLWLIYRGQLPDELPTHWGISGRPDRFGSASASFWFVFAMSGIPAAWALWTTIARRSPVARVLTSALAAMLASIAFCIFASAVLWGLGHEVTWLAPVSVVAGIVVPFAMLVVLARVNRRAEWTEELGPRSTRS